MTRASSLSIRSALWLVSTIWLNQHVAASVISASKASATNFELQTNIVSCGTKSEGSAAAAVCTQPESKLFSNIKVVNGTPRPGPTGVRGRLYDVGTLCQDKVEQKIDRAWVAFLDCSGCPLSTKLANLQNSNPQAILLYNQVACVFPVPVVAPHAPEGSSSAAPPQASAVPASAPQASVAPVSPPEASVAPMAPPEASVELVSPPQASVAPAPTVPAPAPVATPSEPHHDGGDGDKGTSGNGGDGSGEDDEERLKHPKRALRTLPRRQLLERIEKSLEFVKRGHHVSTASLEEPYIESSTTIAMAEQVTIDYLFQVLEGAASSAPLPGALKSIKTVHHSSAIRAQAESNGAEAGDDETASASATLANSITDLMVSISPSYGTTGSGDKKYLSMSIPIFATVVGILSIVVCGVIFLYVVRPLVRWGRRKKSVSEMGESPASPIEYNKEQGPGPGPGDNFVIPAADGYYSVNNRSASNVVQIDDPTEMYPAKLSHEWNRSHDRLIGNTSQQFENSSQPNTVNGIDAYAEQYTQRHLQQLRQQAQEPIAPPKDIIPASHDMDEPRSGLPAWRQDVPATAPTITEAQEIIASYNAKQIQQPDIDVLNTITGTPEVLAINTSALMHATRAPTHPESHDDTQSVATASVASVRNGSSLFEGAIRQTPSNVSFPGPLPALSTSNLAREGGGLASTLRRQRVNIDASTPHSLHHSAGASPHPTIQGSTHSSSVATPGRATPGRASFSDDFATTRRSMDSHRRDIQLKHNELTPSSRGGSTPWAPLLDDFGPTSGRKSLDSLRLPLPNITSVSSSSTENRGGGGISEMDAYKAYKNSRRDPSSGI
ncbi:hypothetical protein BG006_010451 [Podila minutissima]|uniref:Uncharacterized protein n=1 Tax=Podila minutissima TaxID=64525 RepID=A0A9P5SD87_9FUNG|nr:hypothetical protein BG006_010451 [Podila minutissima]